MPTWLDRLLGRPIHEKSLTISRDPGSFVTELRGLDTTWSPDLDSTALQNAQLRNELVFACLAIKAGTVQDPRLVVERQLRRDGRMVYEEVPDHPCRALLSRPNDRMTEADLMRAAIVSWHVSNPRRFYCEKEYQNGLLVGLHPLNPASMTPKQSRTNREQILGYEWREGQERREYSLDELLIRRAPAWYDPPPLVAALGAVESDSAQTQYIRSFFANGGIPPGILKYNMPLSQPQRDEIREKWRATYGNRGGRSHDIGVLDLHVEYQQTGTTLDKLSSDTLRSVAESRICMVFKVPPLIVYAYVGLLRATYSNLKEAWASFWDATMSPEFKEWRMFWLWGLLPEFEDERTIRREQVRLRYDMSQVSALQDDVDTMQNRAERAFRAGGMTLNEYRAQLGLPADTAGNYYLRTLAQVPQAAGEAPLTDPPKRRSAKGRTALRVQLLERRMEQELTRYLAEEYRAAAQAVPV